jgi:glycosyltransferase involved in cell wall biosynthesis
MAQRLEHRPDVVLAVVPSLLGAAAASVLARRANAPLVVWVQDLMGPATAQSGILGGGRIARATGALEGRLLRGARDVVLVSEAFRSYVDAAGVDPDRVHVIPNWTHVGTARQDRASVRSRLGWADDELVALHSGNMGLKQGLENLVETARTAPPGVRIVLMGDGSQRSSLEALGTDVSGLQMLPPAQTEDFPDVLAAADVLLVNERASAVDMSLPSKLTSYFSAGVPIVAAVPADGGTGAEVRRSGAGWLVPPENPSALLDALRELGTQAAQRARLGAAGRAHAQQHLSPEASLGRLTELLASAMPAARTVPVAS